VNPGSLPDAFISNAPSAEAFHAEFGKDAYRFGNLGDNLHDNGVFSNQLIAPFLSYKEFLSAIGPL